MKSGSIGAPGRHTRKTMDGEVERSTLMQRRPAPADSSRAAPGVILVRGALLAGICTTGPDAYAHGFGQRYDLPVPLTFFLTGAAAVVAVSFLVMAIFLGRGHAMADYPRF